MDDSRLVFSRGTLIICPASLVHQWHKEVEKHVEKSNLSVYVYHGSTREKRLKRFLIKSFFKGRKISKQLYIFVKNKSYVSVSSVMPFLKRFECR